MFPRWQSLLAALAIFGILPAGADEPAVDFSRDVRPILSDKCFKCHGPDSQTREADLRLDTRQGLHADRGGYAAVVAGRPDESELLRRIESNDADERMPPAAANLELSDREKQVLRRWIHEGAAWKEHWSFTPIGNVPPPAPSRRLHFWRILAPMPTSVSSIGCLPARDTANT